MIKQAHAISEELIEWRRDFHMHPETGFDVFRTAGIVADELEKMGYRVKRGVGKTGVVAEIGEGGKVVAIRADMDALPIFELNETDYVSQNEGKMHACGHDSHTAMALGAAKILDLQPKEELRVANQGEEPDLQIFVPPGEYKVTLTYGKRKSTATLTVLPEA